MHHWAPSLPTVLLSWLYTTCSSMLLAAKCANGSSDTYDASLEELLLGFFHYYLHVFDHKTHVISIHRDGPAPLKCVCVE
eukprot:3340-Heterococcus_DN1.PRE.1